MKGKVVSVQLLPREWEMFQAEQQAQGISPSELLRRALRDYLLSRETKPAPGE